MKCYRRQSAADNPRNSGMASHTSRCRRSNRPSPHHRDHRPYESLEVLVNLLGRDGEYHRSRPEAQPATQLVLGGGGNDVRDAGRERDHIDAVAGHPQVLADMFETLADERINVELIAATSIRISCVVRAAEEERAVRALHRRFGLGPDGGPLRSHDDDA